MALTILNESDVDAISNTTVTRHDGYTGGTDEKLFTLTNQDPSKYYTNIRIKPIIAGMVAGEMFHSSGWSTKVVAGSTRPSEEEWDQTNVNEEVQLANIGTSAAADINTLHQFWMRIFCPGGTTSQIFKDVSLEVKYISKEVSA